MLVEVVRVVVAMMPLGGSSFWELRKGRDKWEVLELHVRQDFHEIWKAGWQILLSGFLNMH